MAEQQPVIIKKVKKGGHAHHGGAWKLAYADFVTAMMAFFLLMWLISSTSEETRKGIAEYFQDPYKASLMGGEQMGERTHLIQGGGSDTVSQDQGQVDKGKTPEVRDDLPEDMQNISPEELKNMTPEEIEKKAEEIEKKQLENLKEKIQTKIDATPELKELKEQIKLEITPEGLRIQIIDDKNRPMFQLSSAKTEPHIQLILKALAPVINELPNKVSLNGHTDGRPFPANQKGYTNWELSSDRANAARYELNQAGLAEDKVLRVVGLSSSIPYNPSDILDPMNRRISIIVMNKKTEQQILQEAGKEAAVKDAHKEATVTEPPQPPEKAKH